VKNFCRSLFTFAVILCVITIIAGCSVGIRPAYYDLPPSDNNNYNYGESAYNQYNAAPTSSDYRYDYSSTYDPWTMGNYYENYSPPQRSSNVQASTDSNSPWVGDKKPVMKDRGTVVGSESKAPVSDSANLRRERVVQRENASKDTAESSTSSIVNQKTRRNVRRDTPQANQEQPSSQTNIKQENSEPSKSADSKKDEEDKDKKKRKTGTN
jgi:hypothetical protein